MIVNKMECRREKVIEQTGSISKQQQERSSMAKEKAKTHNIAIAFTLLS